MMSTAACCVLATLLFGAGVALAVYVYKRDKPKDKPRVLTEGDLKRELGLSLLAIIAEGEAPPDAGAAMSGAEALVERAAFGELVAAARTWKELGGKPKNVGQFNDMVRALDAVSS